jgi:RNA polymerase sigma factor (sigma-70 family)
MYEVSISGPLAEEPVPEKKHRQVSETIEHERPRLWSFIRNRVANPSDAEDILQDVFYELIEAYQVKSIDNAAAWLFRVARNRIIDFFRKRRPVELDARDQERGTSLADVLPAAGGGPEAAYARSVLIDELDDALAELPGEQREVFIAHEIEGRSFKDLAAATGLSVNTLLSRKHYAVQHLRRRLQAIYQEFQKG